MRNWVVKQREWERDKESFRVPVAIKTCHQEAQRTHTHTCTNNIYTDRKTLQCDAKTHTNTVYVHRLRQHWYTETYVRIHKQVLTHTCIMQTKSSHTHIAGSEGRKYNYVKHILLVIMGRNKYPDTIIYICVCCVCGSSTSTHTHTDSRAT